MELTFNNNDSVYVSEFKVDSDFNLHVERDKLGKFVIWVKTTPVGNYAKVNHEENLDDLYVIDYNFTGTVYPKYIKIVSKVEPTYAAITTDGEVTEIKTQSKEIEITSNGITNITPDSGFAYLDSVKVKTNVAGSGGGGSASSWRYFDVKEFTEDKSQLKPISPFLVKTNERINAAINCKDWSLVIAVGVDAKSKFAYSGGVFTWEEAMIAEGFMEALPTIGIIEITEEEFYRMPHNVVLEDGASDDIKIVFEDLMSKISSYPSDEKFDSPLSSYGYDSISFGGNSFTRVGKYSLNVFGGRDIIYLMISEGDNPEDGWGLYRDNTVSPKEYGLNYPG